MNCFGLKEYISVDCKYQDPFIEYYEILSNIEIIYKEKLSSGEVHLCIS